jgi:hypothetical protein
VVAGVEQRLHLLLQSLIGAEWQALDNHKDAISPLLYDHSSVS